MNKIKCQTPKEHCNGKLTSTNAGLPGKSTKLHSSSQDAFACYANYLVKTGHTQVGQREFLQPGGGILVLTKKSRYGARFRRGKEGNRYLPDSKGHTCRGGCVIG